MSYRPPKAPRAPDPRVKRRAIQKANQIKRAIFREGRYSRAQGAVDPRDAANLGMPDRHSLPAEVVKVTR